MPVNKHIILFEVSTANHYSLVENWLLVAKQNNWSVTVVTVADVFTNIIKSILRDVNYKIIKKRGILKCLMSIRSIYKSDMDNLVLFTSVQSNFFSFFFFSLFSIKYALTMHNVNVWVGNSVITCDVSISI